MNGCFAHCAFNISASGGIPLPNQHSRRHFLEVGDMASKKQKRYHVEFDIELSEDVRLAQIESWVRYHCWDKGRLRNDNPLFGRTFTPVYGTLKVAVIK